MSARGVGATVAKAALLIGVLTALARLAGFGRTFVFARTVGQTCLGDTYQSANTIPNVVFEIVAGGALAGVVVPLLAGSVAAGDRERAARTASALLTWTVSVLVPLAVLVAVLARPLATVLLGDKSCSAAVEVGAQMLRVFAPQVVLYGVGIVLTGILQAHRRFGGPAVAPLLSSLVVIGAYVTFGVVAGAGADVEEVSTGEQLILSLGTTLGVVALSLCLLVPLRGTHLRLRPSFVFPPGMAPRARRLAASGVAALVAQQCAVVVALVLSNAAGVPEGSVTVFLYAQTLYLLPWAILAVPIATSVYPRLSEQAERGDLDAFRRQLRPSGSSILTLASVATAAMVAASLEIAIVMVRGQPGTPSEGPLAAGIAAFAVGLIGYSLFALMSRALYALGDARRNAVAAILGWAVVIAVDLLLSGLTDPADRVAALSWGNSAGVTVLGLALTTSVVARIGEPMVRTWVSVLGTAAAGVGIGFAVRALPLPSLVQVTPDSTLVGALGAGAVRGLLAAVVCAALLALVPGSAVGRLVRSRANGRGRTDAVTIGPSGGSADRPTWNDQKPESPAEPPGDDDQDASDTRARGET